ncbi:hypothetical protein K449DRAFT_401706 [Hypoxylon sp. EC38]|nr:hypothetical protein K449DRAFT_401706 [Hypoxylon sp. EC38]
MSTPSRQRPVSDSPIRQEDPDDTMPDVADYHTVRSPELGNSPRAPRAHPGSPLPGHIQTPRSSRSSSISSVGSFPSQPTPTPTPSSPTRRTNPTSQQNPPLPGSGPHPPHLRPAQPSFGTPGHRFIRTATPGGSPVLLGPPRNPPSNLVYTSSSSSSSSSAVSSRLRSSVLSGDSDTAAPHTPPDALTPTGVIPQRRRNNRVVPRNPRRLSPTETNRRASLLFGGGAGSRGGTPRDGLEPLGWTPPSMKGRGRGKGEDKGQDEEEDEEGED